MLETQPRATSKTAVSGKDASGAGRKARRPGLFASAAAVWRSRDILRLLVRRDLTIKYQQSVLGYLWSLLEPLTIAATYWFVFGVLYKTRAATDGMPYLLFLVSALFGWIWFNGVVSEATTALTTQAKLITTIKVPREIFPIARVIGKFVEFLAALPVLVVIAVLYKAHVGWQLVGLPLGILLQMVLLTGLALMCAAMNVLLRDVERFIRLLLRVMFYLVPIIYPLKLVLDHHLPGWLKDLYQANPLVGIFELYHSAWQSQSFPPWQLIGASAAGCVLFFIAGWFIFRRLEPAVLKEL